MPRLVLRLSYFLFVINSCELGLGLTHLYVPSLFLKEFTILLEERTCKLARYQAPLTYSTHLNFESRN